MLFTEFNMEDALDVRYDEGVQAGIQAGIQTGAKQKAEEIAIRMLKEGKLTAKEIAAYVQGLTVEEIEALKQTL